MESPAQLPGADGALTPPNPRGMWLRRVAGPLVSLGMLALALWALHLLARHVTYNEIRHYVEGVSHQRLSLAIALTTLGFGVMAFYKATMTLPVSALFSQRMAWAVPKASVS